MGPFGRVPLVVIQAMTSLLEGARQLLRKQLKSRLGVFCTLGLRCPLLQKIEESLAAGSGKAEVLAAGDCGIFSAEVLTRVATTARVTKHAHRAPVLDGNVTGLAKES